MMTTHQSDENRHSVGRTVLAEGGPFVPRSKCMLAVEGQSERGGVWPNSDARPEAWQGSPFGLRVTRGQDPRWNGSGPSLSEPGLLQPGSFGAGHSWRECSPRTISRAQSGEDSLPEGPPVRHPEYSTASPRRPWFTSRMQDMHSRMAAHSKGQEEAPPWL